MKLWILCCLLSVFSASALAVDPSCDTSWTKTSSSWTCNGNGKITFSSNTSFVPTGNLTLIAANGFVLSGNTVGSTSIRVNFESSYGDYSISGSTIYGDLTSSSGVFSISNSRLNGLINTGGNIDLTSSTVTGKVTSSSNSVSATGSNLQGGVQAHSGMELRNGTVQGDIVLTAANGLRLQGMTMISGSISGASTIHLHSSTIGSPGNRVTVTAATNDIHVQAGTVVYGDLYAAVAYNGTVFVQGKSDVYGECLPQTQPANACSTPPPASVHHYELSYSSPGLTCEAEPVSIKACTNQACTTLYSGATSITLTATNSGSWTSTSPVFSGGSASSALRKTSTGSSVISFSSASPAASSTPVCKNAGAADSSCSIYFADTGLKIVGSDGVSAVPTRIAGESYNAQLRAVRTNPDTGACEARVQGTRPVRLAYRCTNPSSCIATEQLKINSTNGAGGSNLSGTAAAAALVYQSVDLTFNTSGSAPLGLYYPDVGRIELNAQLSLAASGNDPAITLTAPAASFVVKPYEIRVAGITTANGLVNNPATTNSGTGFVAAGTPFRLVLDVLNRAGNRTPNFGKESSAETLKVAFASLVYPSSGGAGSDANLSNASSFSAVSGSAGRFENVQLRWLEAGSIMLQGLLSDNDYLGAGDVGLKPASGTIGRFYPQHFVLSGASSANLCTATSAPFSYMSQPGLPLNFTLEAMNIQGDRLQNYHHGSYAGTAEMELVAENNGSSHSPNLGNRFSGLPTVTWQHGLYQFNSGSLLQFARSSVVGEPLLNLQPGIKVKSELDNRNLQSTALNMDATAAGNCAVCDAATLGAELQLYYGRYRLENAFGNAFQSLPAVLKAEIWNGSQFVLHSADSCSPVNAALLTATGTPALVISGGATTLGSGVNALNSLLLAPPGQNGSWTLQYQAPAWLKYNWKTAVAGDEDPAATALFGRYRGNDRLIYQREQ